MSSITDTRELERQEREIPHSPLPSAMRTGRAEKSFEADNRLTASAPLNYFMGEVLRHQISSYLCWISFVDETCRWRFDIEVVDWDPSGISIDAFLQTLKHDINAPLNTSNQWSIVNTTTVETYQSTSSRLTYHKKGSCKIRWEWAGDDHLDQATKRDPWTTRK